MLDIKYTTLFKRYQAEVLNDLIKTDHLNKFYHGNPDTRKETFLSLCPCNRHYLESDYYYKGDLKFIHFTSQNKIEAIINSKCLKLFNLSNQNDLQEFKYAGMTLEENEKYCEITRKRIFSLSMCDSEMESDLTLWRFYAEDTRGVGIIIKISNDPINWMHYHLSQIHYGSCEKIETFKRKRAEFESINNFSFPLSLDRFLAFHKSDKFKVEKEIRLIHIIDDVNPFSVLPKYIDYDNLPEYISLDLPIANEIIPNQISDNNKMPQIKIEEIVLGSNFNNKDLLNYMKENLPNVNIRDSSLKDIYRP